MLYLQKFNTEDNLLHTIIKKVQLENWELVLALGYGGGQVFEEFCGKFKYDEESNLLTGSYSKCCDAFEWEFKILDKDVIEQPYEIIDDNDRLTISKMVEEIFTIVEWNEELNQYIIQDSFLSEFNGEVFYSSDWNIDYIDLISNYHWGLTLRFDY